MIMTAKQISNRINAAATFEQIMRGETRIERVAERSGRPEVELRMSDGTVLLLVVKDVICPEPKPTTRARR